MNSRFAFSLAARITFNNESSPRPRARLDRALYKRIDPRRARRQSSLRASRAHRGRAARPDRVVRSRARASLSRVALARRPRRRRAFRETPHRRTASADVAVIARASSLVASFDARVGRVVRASRRAASSRRRSRRRRRASSSAVGSGHPSVRDRGERFSSVYGILEFEFSPTRHVAARWRR
jgi:hypothetical protein